MTVVLHVWSRVFGKPKMTVFRTAVKHIPGLVTGEIHTVSGE